MKKFVVLLLAAIMALSMAFSAAVAEEGASFDLNDLTLRSAGKSYTFPMSLEESQTQGISIEKYKPIDPGYLYYRLDADDGRKAFGVRLENIGGQYWLTGCTLDADFYDGGSVGNITIGETTRAQLVAALGEPATSAETSVTYKAFALQYIWDIRFAEAGDNAVVQEISAYSQLISRFGEVAAAQDVTAAELPDVSTMSYKDFILNGQYYPQGSTVQTLLDNGWKLPLSSAPDSMIEGSGGFLVNGFRGLLYNGTSLVHVAAFNFSEEAKPLADCVIDNVSIYNDYKSELILAEGVGLGASRAEVEAALGTPDNSEEVSNGTKYSYYLLKKVYHNYIINNDTVICVEADELR